MITMYCEGDRVTNKTFTSLYDIEEKDLIEMQERYLNLGFFIQDQIRFDLKDSSLKKKSKKSSNTTDELEISKPERVIYKNLGRKKWIFTENEPIKKAPEKKFRIVIKHNEVEYTLLEFCNNVGISEFCLKDNIRHIDSCKLNGVYIQILRKPRNTTYFDMENIKTGNTLKNKTLGDTRDILKCCTKKLSNVRRDGKTATINGYRLLRHSGDNL